MLHQPHGAGRIPIIGLPQALGLQPGLLVLVGPVRLLCRGRAGRARVGLLLAEVCVDATGFHVFRGDGVLRGDASLKVAATASARGAMEKKTLQYAPSGWTCSSSALRFRVDTAGPVSSLTMAPRSPAGGFACLARHEGGWGFPQPFCNERPVSGACVCREHRCVFIFLFALGLRVLQPRACYRDNVAGCQELAGLWLAPKNYRRRASTLQTLLAIQFSKRPGALLLCQPCC